MRVERTYPVASATYRLSGISTYPAKIVPFALAFRNSRLGGLAQDEHNVMIFSCSVQMSRVGIERDK